MGFDGLLETLMVVVGDDADDMEGVAASPQFVAQGFCSVFEAQLVEGCLVDEDPFFVGRELGRKIPACRQFQAVGGEEVVVDAEEIEGDAGLIGCTYAGDAICPVDLLAHDIRGGGDALDAGLLQEGGLEGLIDGFVYGVLFNGAWAFDDEGLVDVDAELLAAHVLDLLIDEDSADDEDDGDGELPDDEAFAEELAAGGIFKETF